MKLILVCGSGSPKSIRKQVSKVVPVDAVVEDVFGHDYASQGLKCYTPGAGLYIPGTSCVSCR